MPPKKLSLGKISCGNANIKHLELKSNFIIKKLGECLVTYYVTITYNYAELIGQKLTISLNP